MRCLVLPGTPHEAVSGRYPDLEVVEGDIRDPGAVGRFCAGAEGATVFHLAGIIHPSGSTSCSRSTHEGTRHLLAAAAAAGRPRRVVATSSNSPAGRKPRARPRASTSLAVPPLHGLRAVEEADGGRAQRGATRRARVETTILRPCWFYGPDQPPRQSEFFRMIRDGKAPIVGDGESRRSMSYVDNTSLGLLLAAARERAAGADLLDRGRAAPTR